jgi:hypothetical protein
MRREHRLCQGDADEFQSNDEGVDLLTADVLCHPQNGEHWARIEVDMLDEYGLPPADMTGVSIV